jgi:hypothetical protein
MVLAMDGSVALSPELLRSLPDSQHGNRAKSDISPPEEKRVPCSFWVYPYRILLRLSVGAQFRPLSLADLQQIPTRSADLGQAALPPREREGILLLSMVSYQNLLCVPIRAHLSPPSLASPHQPTPPERVRAPRTPGVSFAARAGRAFAKRSSGHPTICPGRT